MLRQVKVVGHIPQGLPPLTLGQWALPMEALPQMMTTALTITLVGLMESIAVAKALADSHGYQISANQELLGDAPMFRPSSEPENAVTAAVQSSPVWQPGARALP